MASLTIEIEGTDVTDQIILRSVSIRKSLSNRSTLKFTVRQDAQHYEPGETVMAYWGGSAIFGGKIETVDEELMGRGGTSDLVTSIEVSDWSRLLDRFVVANSYPHDADHDFTVEEIVQDILDNQCQDLSALEGVTLDPDVPLAEPDTVNFRYVKVSDCLRDLCQLFGLTWTISASKVIAIRDRSTYAAPFTIGYGAGASLAYRNLSMSRSVDQYRNTQWLIGGKDQTSELTEYFRGDATTTTPEKRRRTFNLAFPAASITSITRGATAQRVGDRGVDKDGDLTSPSASEWKQWFYAVDSTEISQNTFSDEVNNPTLAQDEILTVVYKGYFPIVEFEEDTAEVAARAASEGGSGRYFDVEEDQKCDTLTLAQAKAQRYLEQYGRIPRQISFETDLTGLEPGHLMTIEIPGHAINSQFMVEDVSVSFPTPGLDLMRCKVKAIDGERIDGWAEFWRRSAMAGRDFSIRANEVVAKAIRPAETVTIDDTFAVNSAGGITIPGYRLDPYSVALFGTMTTAGGETVPLARYGRSKRGAHAA